MMEKTPPDFYISEVDQKYASLQGDEESGRIRAAVEELVADLTSAIVKEQPRFTGWLIKSGSFYDGTKIIQADEFDFLWCLKDLSHSACPTSSAVETGLAVCSDQGSTSSDTSGVAHSKPYVQIFCKDRTSPNVFVKVVNKSDQDVWRDCLNEAERYEDYLDAGKIKRCFFFAVEKALSTTKLDPSLKLLSSTGIMFTRMKSMNMRGAMQFGVPETFEFLWNGTQKISVDISVCIQLDHWPAVASLPEKVNVNKPEFSFLQGVMRTGFIVVPKIDVLWRLSLALAEKNLLKHITEVTPHLITCYRTIKYLNETHFLNENQTVKLTDSYILKTVLFHYWFKKMLETSDTPSVLGGLTTPFFDVLAMLQVAMETEHLPQIFHPTCNVMKGGPWVQNCAKALAACIEQIKNLLQDACGEGVLQTLLQSKIEVDSPPRKRLSDYKIKVIK